MYSFIRKLNIFHKIGKH